MTDRRKRDKKFKAAARQAEALDIDNPEGYFRSGMAAAAKAMSFCAPAIRALTPVFTDRVPTMAVDKYFRVYANPDFILEMIEMAKNVSAENPCAACGDSQHHPIAYVAGVICHEAWHPLREHHVRAQDAELTNFYIWNIATDMEINDDLMQIFGHNTPKLCLPPVQVMKDGDKKEGGVLVPKVFDMEDGRLAEHYYYELLKKADEQREKLKELMKELGDMQCPSCGSFGQDQNAEGSDGDQDGQGQGQGDQAGDGSEGQGQGQGGSCSTCGSKGMTGEFGDFGDCGSAMDGRTRDYEEGPPKQDGKVPGLSAAEQRMVRKNVAKEIKEAAKSRGNMPGGFSRWAELELEAPKYDWRQEMKKVLRYTINRVPGDELRTYRRLGRRTASVGYKAILPSHYNPAPRAAIVQDTSGSMDDKALQESLVETEGIIKATGAAVTYINCDMQADVQQNVSSAKQAKLYGGGGTDMRVGIKAAVESHPQPSLVILFTDGYTPWPEERLPFGMQLVVCLVGDHACKVNDVPHWIRAIKIVGPDSPEVRPEGGV